MQDMEIRTFREKDLAAVVRLYNALVATIPCNWPVTEAEFFDEVMGQGRLADPDSPFDPGSMLIASAAGSPVGFADCSATGEVGLIRFLTFPEGQPEIGDALLRVAIERLRRSGYTGIEAWRMQNGYPFYTSKHGGCWEQSHIANLFLCNGFENHHREVMFRRVLDFGCEQPEPLDGRLIRKSTERFGHDLLYRYAIHDGKVEAARTSWHRMSALSRHPAARDHGYVFEVATAKSYRRQRLGTTLMQQMLFDIHAAGVREVTLHTMFDNVPAIALYTKAAFRCLGTNVILRKAIA